MENSKKPLEEEIKRREHFIQKMHAMGEKWCSYPLIRDELKLAAERIKECKEELEKLENN